MLSRSWVRISLKRCHALKGTNIRHVNYIVHQASSISASISAPEHPFLGMSQWRSWKRQLGGVVEVVGSNLARGKIFTASIGSVDSLYHSVFICCLNLHQFLILCSSKAMMFVKLYLHTSDIYLISLVSLDPSGFHLRTK